MENLDPAFIIGVMFGAVLGGVCVRIYHWWGIKRRARWFAANDTKNPANQLRFLQHALIGKKPVMGREAYRRFKAIEDYLQQMGLNAYRVIPETTLGAIVKLPRNAQQPFTKDQIESGFRCKRVDFVIIDRAGNPVLCVEYHGTGHNQGDYEARDAVKALALERANIPLLIITKAVKRDQLNAWLDHYLTPRFNGSRASSVANRPNDTKTNRQNDS